MSIEVGKRGVVLFAVFAAVLLAAPASAAEFGEVDEDAQKQQMLHQMINNLGGRPSVAQDAADKLGKIGAMAVPELLKVMRSDNLQERYYAASALSVIDDRRATRVLYEHLKSETEHRWVKRKCVRSMGLIGFKPAASIVVKLGRDTEDPEMRRECVIAAASINAPESDVFLVEVLKNGTSAELRAIAAKGLGEHGAAEAVEALAAAVMDEDMEVSASAVAALQRMGKPSMPAAGALIETMERGDDDYRKLVRGALRVITGRTYRTQESWRGWLAGMQTDDEEEKSN